MLLPRNQVLELPADNSPRDQDSYGARILAACWFVEVLSGIILSLRVYCKLKRSRELWYDDHILIASWIFQTTNVILITVNVSLGEGQHVYNLNPTILPTLGLNGNVSGTLSIIAALLSKTSFGVTLLRLSIGRMRWIIWFLLVTMNLALGLSAIFIWAQCTPAAKNWSPGMVGTCWNPTVTAKYGLFSGVYSAFVDFALSFLPWPLIWNLQMQMREKIGVVVAMSMGVFAGLGAIAKVLQLHNLSSSDFTYYESEIVIWGTVESAVTIMAASVPFLRILVIEARSSLAAQLYAARLKIPGGESDEQGLVVHKNGVEKHPAMARSAPAAR